LFKGAGQQSNPCSGRERRGAFKEGQEAKLHPGKNGNIKTMVMKQNSVKRALQGGLSRRGRCRLFRARGYFRCEREND